MSKVESMAERRKKALLGAVNDYQESKTANENRFSYVDKAKLAELGIEKYTNNEGMNALQILPSKDPDSPFAKRIFFHNESYKAKGVQRFHYPHVLCLDKMFGNPCPICEAGKLSTVPDSLKNDFRVQQRFLMFVASYAPKDDPQKIYYLDCPKTLYEELVLLIRPSSPFGESSPGDEIIDPTDFSLGLAFTFKYNSPKSGSPASYSMTKLEAIPKSVRLDPIPKSWSDVPDIDAVLKVMDYDQTFAAWDLSKFKTAIPPVTANGSAIADESFDSFFNSANSPDDGFAGFAKTEAESDPAEDFTAAESPTEKPVEGDKKESTSVEDSMNELETAFDQLGDDDNPFGDIPF